jgi:hypothetical protein
MIVGLLRRAPYRTVPSDLEHVLVKSVMGCDSLYEVIEVAVRYPFSTAIKAQEDRPVLIKLSFARLGPPLNPFVGTIDME